MLAYLNLECQIKDFDCQVMHFEAVTVSLLLLHLTVRLLPVFLLC